MLRERQTMEEDLSTEKAIRKRLQEELGKIQKSQEEEV
jgi:hypothetical protein